MPLYASWVHGNAVTVETPQNLARVGHFGWGGDMQLVPGKGSWMHIPLPTPVIVGDVRTTVQTFFLTYRAENCEIRAFHVFDGSERIQEFNDLHLSGEHRSPLDAQNTFTLSAPRTVLWGIGLTFFVQAAIGFDTVIVPRLIIASAGGDFLA
jgi:hypothetical protein